MIPGPLELDVVVTRLQIAGNAQFDPFVARALRTSPADVISVKLGINLVNFDAMRLGAFVPAVHGFLDLIREGHPDTPLVVVSPIVCPIVEDTPGPTVMQIGADHQIEFAAAGDPADVAAGKLTLSVIRAKLGRIVSERRIGDLNLYYLDGREMLGAGDLAATPLPDGLHASASGYRVIGERFAELVFGPDELIPQPTDRIPHRSSPKRSPR